MRADVRSVLTRWRRTAATEHSWPSTPLRGTWILLALLTYSLIAVSLTAAALTGERSLLPEGFLDQDLLYARPDKRAATRPFANTRRHTSRTVR